MLPTIGRGVSSLLGLTAEAPVASSLIGADIGRSVVGGGMDFLQSLDLGGGYREEAARQARARMDLEDMAATRERRSRQLRLANLARAASVDPDAYSQVSAGRRLPKGSVVIGGSPRVDLLTQLADGMSAGTLEGA